MRPDLIGPALIGLAALLWATDALFRVPSVASLDATFIVFVEHAFALVFLAPWILWRRRAGLFKLSGREWTAAALVGVGGSAIATVLFTAAFRYVNPSVVILLQKLQPVMVVLLAYAFLGERPARSYYAWAAVAFVAALILTFPDFGASLIQDGGALRLQGVAAALGASIIWAVSTVAGKVLLKRVAPAAATFWRFGFGLLALAVMLAAAGQELPRAALADPAILRSLAYMSLVPGLIAMLAYYAGLERTAASVTTLIELIFPVGAVILNAIFLDAPLSAVQLLAGTVLLFAVTRVSVRRETVTVANPSL